VFFAPNATEAGPVLSDKAAGIVAGWRHYPAMRSDRARVIFKRLSPGLLRRLDTAAHPDEALMALDGFLRGLPAGVQVFSLFEANPLLVDLVIDIAATAPALASYLSRHSRVLDAVIGGTFFADWPGISALTDDLNMRLHATDGYEQKLDAARVWQQEWHFRIGVHHLRGLTRAEEAGVQYADLAGAVLAALFPVVVADLASRHGPPPGRGATLIGMGSLGAGRLNAGSDLDLIVIYDAQGAEASVGARPLATRAYFARLTQGLVTALTAPMAQGRLYEVDMRLRPSGRQGPVATSWDAFRAYQQDEAWTWEHLALTRARVVAGDAGLGAEVEAFRAALIVAKGQGAAVRADVADMRARLAVAKPGGKHQAKDGPGRLQDIDLVAQMAALMSGSGARATAAQLAAAVEAGILNVRDAAVLSQAAGLCWQMQAGMRLLSVTDWQDTGQGARAFLGGDGAVAALAQACDAAAQVIDRVMHGETMGGIG
jgi:[glutamine synthetase] adenylyltransferase / [glutamine synthetase]-adenylyl-L-tyrosine phosphorylase